MADITLEDIQRVVQGAIDGQTTSLQQSLSNERASLSAEIGADSDALAKASATAAAEQVAENAGTGTFELTAEQWQEVKAQLEFQRNSLQLQNAFLVFTLMLCAGLVGMRVFSEFARGIRHG